MAATLNLTVTEVADSVNVAENTSKVKIVLKITTDDGTYNEAGDTSGYVKLDGIQIADLYGEMVHNNNTKILYSGTHTVKHNADGSKTVKVEAGFDVNASVRWIYAEKVLILSKIPRASTMTVPTFTLGSKGTLTVKSASSTFKHKVTYSFQGLTGTAVAESADTTLYWTPPLEAFANKLPNAVSGTGTLTLITYSGGTEIGSKSYTFTANVPTSVVPSATLTVSLVNSNSTLSGWGLAAKGKTKVKFTITAQGKYGSTINEGKCYFSFAGQTVTGALNGTTGLVTKAGSFAPQAVVTDSRKRTYTVSLSKITVYDYSVPSITSSNAYRSNSAGSASDSGTYIAALCKATCSPVNGKNSVTVRVRTRPAGGSWSSYTTLTNGTRKVLSGFSLTKSYDIELSATDALSGTKTVLYNVSTTSVTFHLKEGGNGAGFGKYAETENRLECAWDADFNKNVNIDGTLTVGGGSVFNLMYPVGSICITDSATSPANKYGGTWKLVKKEFIELADDYAFGTADCPFEMSENVSGGALYVVRSGQTLRMRLDFTTAVALSDTAVILGALDWAALGVQTTYASVYGGVAYGDAANSVAFVDINYSTGVTTVSDIIRKDGGTSIDANSSLYLTLVLVIDSSRMINAYCDKFYWKRTA